MDAHASSSTSSAGAALAPPAPGSASSSRSNSAQGSSYVLRRAPSPRLASGSTSPAASESERAEMQRRRASNEKKERAIDRLKECDEHLASLLSQAAGSLSTLVSVASDIDRRTAQTTQQLGDDGAEDDILSVGTGAERVRAFEAKATEWFATLNDVQSSLRTAVATLRADSRSALSAAAPLNSYVARVEAGSATRGHDVGLRDAFGARASTSASGDAELSLGALRLQHRSWTELNGALAQLAEDMPPGTGMTRDAAAQAAGTTRPPLHSFDSSTSIATVRPLASSISSAHDLAEGGAKLLSRKQNEDARLIGALFGFGLPPRDNSSSTRAPRRSSHGDRRRSSPRASSQPLAPAAAAAVAAETTPPAAGAPSSPLVEAEQTTAA